MKMIYSLLVVTSIFASLAYGAQPVQEKYLNLIEANIDPHFQGMANSLLEKANIANVSLVQNRVVIDIDTSKMSIKVDVQNGYDSYKKTKAFKKVTSIPFPRTTDLESIEIGKRSYAEVTYDYLKFMGQFGLSMTAGEVLRFDEMNLYFMVIEHNPLIGPHQKVYVELGLTDTGSSFDNDHFYWNGCDTLACWGSRNVDLEIIHK